MTSSDRKTDRETPCGFNANRSRGITLIELGFVVGIIAIIVVGVLTIYNTVKRQQEVTEVTGHVAAIRNAVSTWSGGRGLSSTTGTGDDAVTEEFLKGWMQLHAYLPGDLGSRAKGVSGTILSEVNSWEKSTYEYSSVATEPYLWEVTITEIPLGLGETLHMRLSEGADEITPTMSSDVDNARSLTVRYRL